MAKLRLIVAFLALTLGGCGGSGGVHGVAGLAGKRVGVEKGTTSEAYVQKHASTARLRRFQTTVAAFDALQHGELDAVVNDEQASADALRTRRELEIAARIDTGEQYGLALPKGSPLLRTVNGALATVKSDGTYAEIYRRWFRESPPRAILRSRAEPLNESAPPGTFHTKGGPDRLLVAAEVPFTPFEFGSPPNYEGFDVDIVNSIARDIGLQVRFVNVPFEKLLPGLAGGRFDMVASAVTITPQRARQVDFSEPYFTAQQAIVVRR
jgi:ABC-type amino acid transport substrate-binding protein